MIQSVTAYRTAFWSLLAVVFILSLVAMPEQQLQLFSWQDKLIHAVIYGALFALLVKAYGAEYRLWLLATSLAVFGLLVEVAQSFTGYRQPELWDFIANSLGIFLVYLLALTIAARR